MLKNVNFLLEINCKGRSVESKFLKYVQRQKYSVHHILSFSLHMLRMALGKLFILIRESTISDLIFYIKAVIILYFYKILALYPMLTVIYKSIYIDCYTNHQIILTEKWISVHNLTELMRDNGIERTKFLKKSRQTKTL